MAFCVGWKEQTMPSRARGLFSIDAVRSAYQHPTSAKGGYRGIFSLVEWRPHRIRSGSNELYTY